jgi:hypothetical protein
MQLECTNAETTSYVTLHDYQVPGLDIKPEFVKNEGYVNMVFPSAGLADKIRITV